jgi:hypothetical protein
MQELNRRTTAMPQSLGVFDYTSAQYHASEGLSRSSLWTFKQLPYKFWYEKLSGQYEPPADKEAFILGDLVHAMTLEPDTFNDLYMVMPNIDKRTKSGKVLYAQVMDEACDRQLVKPETMGLAKEMSSSLMCNATVCDLLRDAKMEKSIYWKHEATGLICKARPDVWQGGIVSDLKTTQDAGFRAFQLSAYKYGYFLQAAMIYEALKSIGEPFHNFVNICVEKTKPYAIGLYMLDDEALQFGIDMFHALMERIALCFDKNVWPDYGIQKLTVPRYAIADEVEHE